jgi:glyoxylase-like metal-dependent hydrolase (beta-lactamase superfamily II)
MILERFVNGRARSNAYVFAPSGDRAIIIDPGVGAASKIMKVPVEPEAILVTHGHPDHVWTAAALSEHYGIPVFVHRRDWCWLDDPACGGYVPLVKIGGRLLGRVKGLRPKRLHPIDGHQRIGPFEVLHTPGHTAGSVCFLADDLCFVGDTVFAGGIGHTIYPGGERRALLDSIRRELLTLGDDVRLMPGHGVPTTVREVRRWIS